MCAPCAVSRNWTLDALRCTGRTHRRAQVHQNLVPFPCGPLWHQVIRETLDSRFPQWLVDHSAEYARDVGVHDRDVARVGKGQHRSSRVTAYAGKFKKQIQLARNLAAMIAHHHFGCFVKIATPARITKPLPQCKEITKGCIGAFARGGKRFDEPFELRQHAMHLGLLQHHLTHEHMPPIARATPRQIAQSLRTPFQHGVDDFF